MSIDQQIDQAFKPIADIISNIIFYAHPFEIMGETMSIPLILGWLVAISLFLTVYLGFVNIWHFKHAVNLVRGKYDKKEYVPIKSGLSTGC